MLTFLKEGLTIRLIRDLILFCILFALSLIDIDTYTIPDGLLLAGAINWIIFQFFIRENTMNGILGGVIIGGSMLIISLILDHILKKESMGGGDIKLLAMVCLYTGPVLGLFLVFLSCVIGLLFVYIGKNDKIPFGPSISIATFFTILWGEQLLQLYLQLF